MHAEDDDRGISYSKKDLLGRERTKVAAAENEQIEAPDAKPMRVAAHERVEVGLAFSVAGDEFRCGAAQEWLEG